MTPAGIAPVAERVEPLHDQAAALSGVDDDSRFAERALVVGGVLDHDLSGREAVACGSITRGDGVGADVDRRRAVLGAEPADRPRKPDLVGLREARDPRHGLPCAEAERDLPEPVAQGGRLAATPDVAVAKLELVHGEAEPAREALGRFRRLALGEGDRLRRPALLLASLFELEVLDDERDAPRPDERERRAAAERRRPTLKQLLLRPATERGGKLFAADLEEEPAHEPPCGELGTRSAQLVSHARVFRRYARA